MFSKWIIILCAALHPLLLLITGSLVARCLPAVTSRQHAIPTRCWTVWFASAVQHGVEKRWRWDNGKAKRTLSKWISELHPLWPPRKLTHPIRFVFPTNLFEFSPEMSTVQVMWSLNWFFLLLLLFCLCSNWCIQNFLRVRRKLFCKSCEETESGLKQFCHLHPAAVLCCPLFCWSAFKRDVLHRSMCVFL